MSEQEPELIVTAGLPEASGGTGPQQETPAPATADQEN